MALGQLLQVGDTVIINIPDDNWSWGYHPVERQSGIEAKITGFGEIHYHRHQTYGKEPGVYTNHSWVTLDILGEKTISSSFIDLKDKMEYDSRCASRNIREFDTNQKPIRPLPETKFWEGDIVKLNRSVGYPEYLHNECYVRQVNYQDLKCKRIDGSPMPEYDIAVVGGCGAYVGVNESSLELVRRGNIWKYYNGEQPSFADLREQAEFFYMIGKMEEIANPATGSYAWTLNEALQAIRDGVADCFKATKGLFGTDDLNHRVFKVKDRDLGEKLREATVFGFRDIDQKVS
jgi:hypothetical protein